MWDINLKVNEQIRQTNKNIHRQQYGCYHKKGVRVVKDKGVQIYDDRKIFDLGLWAHKAIYR